MGGNGGINRQKGSPIRADKSHMRVWAGLQVEGFYEQFFVDETCPEYFACAKIVDENLGWGEHPLIYLIEVIVGLLEYFIEWSAIVFGG